MRVRAGQALAMLARSAASAPGAGSVATTSRPCASARAAVELLARLGRREGAAAEQLDDVDRLLDELSVRGEHALLQEEIVLETDADVAAEQHGLGHHRHLHAADAEAGPMALLRQLVDEGFHRGRIGRRAPG